MFDTLLTNIYHQCVRGMFGEKVSNRWDTEADQQECSVAWTGITVGL